MQHREKSMARIRAVKVLDYAMSTSAGTANCYRFVESFGLKTLFPMFMGKVGFLMIMSVFRLLYGANAAAFYFLGSEKTEKGIQSILRDGRRRFVRNMAINIRRNFHSHFQIHSSLEHILGIIISLFKNLPQDDIQRLRLIRKFSDENFEKVDRLFDLLEHYHARDAMTQTEIETEKEQLDEEDLADMADQFYIRRLDAGLFTLQRICLAIVVLCEEDERVLGHALMLLNRKDRDMSFITSLIDADESLAKEMETARGPIFSNQPSTEESKVEAMDTDSAPPNVDQQTNNI
jgi:beta-catenin-like protein 1